MPFAVYQYYNYRKGNMREMLKLSTCREEALQFAINMAKRDHSGECTDHRVFDSDGETTDETDCHEDGDDSGNECTYHCEFNSDGECISKTDQIIDGAQIKWSGTIETGLVAAYANKHTVNGYDAYIYYVISIPVFQMEIQ